MSTFGYIALDKSGKEVKGNIEADNQSVVQIELKNRGLTLLEVSEQTLLTKDINFDFRRVKERDLSVFCRQFVSMTKAGVTIIEAIRLLAEQTENKKLQKALLGVQANVEKGESLSSSLEEYPNIFPNLMINTISAGEASGNLEVSFERMAVQLERTAKTKALIKKAMIYPLVVCVVAIVVVIVMLAYVIPKYEVMFQELGTKLPGITIAVISMSRFIRNYWFILVPLIIVLAIGLKAYAATTSGKLFFGYIAMKTPVFGKLAVKEASSQLARTLSTLLSSGVPLEEAVEITSRVMTNIHYKNVLIEARNEVLQGVPLSKPLEDSKLFPPMVYHMIRIGEESGSTEEMLNKLADYYDDEVELTTQSLMALMEPLIIIILAVVVGGLVAACIAPMLQMYTSLDNL